MKILSVVTQMEAGGAQSIAAILHRAFAQRQHDSELVFLYQKRPSHCGQPGVTSLYPARPGLLRLPMLLARVCRLLRTRRPHALVTHTHYANLLCQPLAALCRVPIRIAVHHNPAPTFPRGVRAADRVLGCCGIYSRAVCVSQVVADSFASAPPAYRRRLQVIVNGVHLPAPSAFAGLAARWPILTRRPLLLATGRLALQKNHQVLLHSLTRIPQATLVVAGEGELRPQLELLARKLGIAERVLFPGELPPAEIAALLDRATLFLMPSLWEAMPMALLEAMHAGKAIVAGDIPALRETLGDAALFVSPHHPEALAASLRTLLADPARRRSLQAASRQRSACFSAQAMADSYCALLDAQAAATTCTARQSTGAPASLHGSPPRPIPRS